MAVITVPGPYTGSAYRIKIAGDTPTVDEQIKIDTLVNQEDTRRAREYEAEFGKQLTSEGEGILNYLGEFPKGIARGGVGAFESAGLGLASLLPERFEAPTREFIRGQAYGLKPQADVGLEETVGGKFGEALGSFGGIAATSLLPGAAPARIFAAALGAGEASERARAAGATEEERGLATLLGAPVGLSELLPFKFFKVLGRPATGTIANRISRAAASGGVEGAQEAATTVAQNLIEQGVYNPEQGTFAETGEALGYGAGVGAFVQALLDLALPGKPRAGTVPPAATTPAPTTTPAAPAAPPTLALPPPSAFPPLPVINVPPTGPSQVSGQVGSNVPAPRAPAVPSPAAGTPAPAVPPTAGAPTPAISEAFDVEATVKALRDAKGEQGKAAQALGIKYPELKNRIRALESEGRIAFDSASGKMTFPTPPTAPTVAAAPAAEPKKGKKAKAAEVAPLVAPTPAPVEAAAPALAEAPVVEAPVVEAPVVEAPAPAETPVVEAAAPAVETPAPAPEIAALEAPAPAPEVAPAPTPAPFNKDEALQLLSSMGVPKGAQVYQQTKNDKITTKADFDAALRTFGGKTKSAPVRSSIESYLAPPPPPPPAPPSGRQYIPSSRVKVDPVTLQATSKPFFRPGDEALVEPAPAARPAPAPTEEAPSRFAPVTMTPEEQQFADEAELTQRAVAQAELNAMHAEWMARSKTPGIDALAEDFSIPDNLVGEDPTTSADKRAIITVLKRETFDETGDAPAKHAKTYFSRFKRPIDALDWIAADAAVAEANKTRKGANKIPSKVTYAELVDANEDGLLPEARVAMTPAEKVFFAGLSSNNGAQAAKWVEENLSPSTQRVFRDLLRFHKAAAEARMPYRVGTMTLDEKVQEQVAQEGAALPELSDPEKIAARQEAQRRQREIAAKEMEAAQRKAVREAEAAARAEQRIVPAGAMTAAAKARDARESAQDDALVARILGNNEAARPKVDKAAKAQAAAFMKWQNRGLLNRINDEFADLDRPLHPAVANPLMNGDLRTALRMLALYAPNDRIARTASQLSAYTRGVKVSVVKDLDAALEKAGYGAAPAGFSTYGTFLMDTNTIYLDADTGLTGVTLLHEMLHAATYAQLRDPANPYTQQLQKIFAEARPLLKDINGARSIDEFVAEAMTNPKFQDELAMLHPKGRRFSVLDRLLNTVANFLRRMFNMPQKPLSNALDVVDFYTRAIMAPVPEARTGGMLYRLNTPSGISALMDGAANLAGSFPEPTKELAREFGDRASGVLAQTGDTGKRIMLGLLGMQSVGDIAAHYGLGGFNDLQNAIREMDSAAVQSDQEVDGVLKEIEDWLKKHRGFKETFDNVVYTSTTNQVDPSLTLERAREKYGKNSEKLATYTKMQREWQSLGAEGQALYNLMRETYRKQYMRLKDALFGRIDDTLGGETTEAKQLKANLMIKFFDFNQIEPYFPLTRKGDYWLEYTAVNPETNTTEPVKQAFESPNARDRALLEIATYPEVVKGADGKPLGVRMYNSTDLTRYRGAPDSLFVTDTLKILRERMTKAGATQETIDGIQRDITKLFIEALPETSFAKSLQKRQNTAGFDRDAFGAFKQKAYTLGRQAQRFKYSTSVRRATDAIREQAKETADANKIAVAAELIDRAEFALNPPNDAMARAVQAANRFAFTFTIGFNASSAVVNLSSLGVVVYPVLAGKYGYRATASAMKDAGMLYGNSGFSQEVRLPTEYMGKTTTTVRSMPSIDNYYTLDANGNHVIRAGTPEVLRAKLEELIPLIDLAAKNGQLNRSIFYDSIGAEEVGRSRTNLDKMNALSGAMFHNVERFNRQVTLVAAYNLELARLNQRPKPNERNLTTEQKRKRAAEQALYQTTEVTGGSTLVTAPRLSQSGILRAAFMFKNYGLTIAYLQGKLIKQIADNAFPGNDPERVALRNAAIKQLVGIQMSAFLFAGLAGVPLYGAASMIMDMFLGDDEEDADMITRRYIGELAYKGLLTEATGLDVSSRIGLTGLLISDNRYNADTSVEESIVAALGGPAYSTISQFSTGVAEVYRAMTGGEGDMVRGVENMIPAAFRNAVKSFRYASEGASIDTRRGDLIVGDLSVSDLAGKALGFNPHAASLQQDINQLKSRVSKNIPAKRSSLMKMYYVALREGDIEGARDVLAQIRAFNERMQELGYTDAVIERENIERSLRSHIRESKEMSRGVSLSPTVREALADLEGQYDRGFQLFQ